MRRTMIIVAVALGSLLSISLVNAQPKGKMDPAAVQKFTRLQHQLEQTVNARRGIKTAPIPKTQGSNPWPALIKQMLRTDQAMLRNMVARMQSPTTVQLNGGDDTVGAFRQAKRSGKPTVIVMDFGSLHVTPGQKPRFEVTTGVYNNDTVNSVRRAHNLAYSIGPVVVTRNGSVIGTATRDSASEGPLLKSLSAGLK